MGSSIPSTIIADPRPVPSPRNSIRPPLKLPSACIAASLSIFTGHPKALLKSNLIHPPPRLCGSRSGCPLMIGPGYPRDTRSNFQCFTHSLTTRTILPARQHLDVCAPNIDHENFRSFCRQYAFHSRYLYTFHSRCSKDSPRVWFFLPHRQGNSRRPPKKSKLSF